MLSNVLKVKEILLGVRAHTLSLSRSLCLALLSNATVVAAGAKVVSVVEPKLKKRDFNFLRHLRSLALCGRGSNDSMREPTFSLGKITDCSKNASGDWSCHKNKSQLKQSTFLCRAQRQCRRNCSCSCFEQRQCRRSWWLCLVMLREQRRRRRSCSCSHLIRRLMYDRSARRRPPVLRTPSRSCRIAMDSPHCVGDGG